MKRSICGSTEEGSGESSGNAVQDPHEKPQEPEQPQEMEQLSDAGSCTDSPPPANCNGTVNFRRTHLLGSGNAVQDPNSVRVLVFNEDAFYFQQVKTCLEEEYGYEVTRCDEEEKAMSLLRDHKIRFTIAVIEVESYSDSDRFRLVSKIGSELHIPIILMSEDKSVESMLKWLSNAACCEYLVKPITPQDLGFIIFKQVTKIRARNMECGCRTETSSL